MTDNHAEAIGCGRAESHDRAMAGPVMSGLGGVNCSRTMSPTSGTYQRRDRFVAGRVAELARLATVLRRDRLHGALGAHVRMEDPDDDDPDVLLLDLHRRIQLEPGRLHDDRGAPHRCPVAAFLTGRQYGEAPMSAVGRGRGGQRSGHRSGYPLGMYDSELTIMGSTANRPPPWTRISSAGFLARLQSATRAGHRHELLSVLGPRRLHSIRAARIALRCHNWQCRCQVGSRGPAR